MVMYLFFYINVALKIHSFNFYHRRTWFPARIMPLPCTKKETCFPPLQWGFVTSSHCVHSLPIHKLRKIIINTTFSRRFFSLAVLLIFVLCSSIVTDPRRAEEVVTSFRGQWYFRTLRLYQTKHTARLLSMNLAKKGDNFLHAIFFPKHSAILLFFVAKVSPFSEQRQGMYLTVIFVLVQEQGLKDFRSLFLFFPWCGENWPRTRGEKEESRKLFLFGQRGEEGGDRPPWMPNEGRM